MKRFFLDIFKKFRKSYKKVGIGIFVGKQALYIAVLKREMQPPKIDAYSLPEEYESFNLQQRAAFFSHAFARSGVQSGEAVLSLDDAWIFSRETVLPPLAGGELAAVARWEIETNLAADEPAWYWDFAVLAADAEEDGQCVLLAAASENLIDAWVALFAMLPVHLAAIEPQSLSLARLAKCGGDWTPESAADAKLQLAAAGALLRIGEKNGVNLLPPALRPEKTKAARRGFAAAAVGGVVLAAMIYACGAARIAAIQEEIEQAQVSHQLLLPMETRQTAFEENERLTQMRNSLLVKLSAERQSAYALLLCLGRHAITGIRLTDAELTGGGDVVLRGEAQEYAQLTRLVQALAHDDLLEDAALARSESSTDARAMVRFEVHARSRAL